MIAVTRTSHRFDWPTPRPFGGSGALGTTRGERRGIQSSSVQRCAQYGCAALALQRRERQAGSTPAGGNAGPTLIFNFLSPILAIPGVLVSRRAPVWTGHSERRS